MIRKSYLFFIALLLATDLVSCSSGAASGSIIEVYPTGDPLRDGDAIQAAIDAAKDGDTILLKARNEAGEPTPFVVGKSEAAGDVVEDFKVKVANGEFLYYENFCKKAGWLLGTRVETWMNYYNRTQCININRSLTLRGEGAGTDQNYTLPDGKAFHTPPTKIKARPGDLKADGIIVINAPGVTIENLTFEGGDVHAVTRAIAYAFSPGFNINNCLFDRCWEIGYFSLDANLVYRDAYKPVRSHIRDNVLMGAVTVAHFVGGGITFQNNLCDLSDKNPEEARQGYGLIMLTWQKRSWLDVDHYNKTAEVRPLPYDEAAKKRLFDWTRSGDYIVEGNVIYAYERWFGITSWNAYFMPDEDLEPLKNIVVRRNTIKDPQYCGVYLRNSGGTTVVERNTIENSGGVTISRDTATDPEARIHIRNNTITMRDGQLDSAGLELHEQHGIKTMNLRAEGNTIHAADTKLYPIGPIFCDNLKEAMIAGNTVEGDSGSSPPIYLNSGTTGCQIIGNRIGSSGVAGIMCAGRDNRIADNDFADDFEGWTDPYLHSDGIPAGKGWILLTPASRGNRVEKTGDKGRKPDSHVCAQVLDLPDWGGPSALVGDTSKVRIAPNGQHILRKDDTKLVAYDRIGSAGFANPTDPTSAQYFDFSPAKVLSVLRYVEDLKDIDPQLEGVSGYVLDAAVPGYKSTASLVKTEATENQPARINIWGFDIPNPEACGVIAGLKNNQVEGCDQCPAKPSGFIEAMQKTLAEWIKPGARSGIRY